MRLQSTQSNLLFHFDKEIFYHFCHKHTIFSMLFIHIDNIHTEKKRNFHLNYFWTGFYVYFTYTYPQTHWNITFHAHIIALINSFSSLKIGNLIFVMFFSFFDFLSSSTMQIQSSFHMKSKFLFFFSIYLLIVEWSP